MVEKFDYLESQQDADELIAEFRQVGAIRRSTIDRENEWEDGEEVTTFFPVTLVVLPIDEKRIDGTVILTGDRQVLIAMQGLTITPAVGEIVMFNGAFSGAVYVGEEWSITKLDTLAPAGVTVMYDAVVRR